MAEFYISLAKIDEKKPLTYKACLPIYDSERQKIEPVTTRGYFHDRDHAVNRLEAELLRTKVGNPIEIYGAESEYIKEELKKRIPRLNLVHKTLS